MLRFKVTDNTKIKATKKLPKTIRFVSGDPLFYANRKDGKEIELDEPRTFDKSFWVCSEGESFVTITIPKEKLNASR